MTSLRRMAANVAILFSIGVLPATAAIAGQHAIAMHGAPKEAPGFAHFRYANPQAPKGGRRTLGILGSFDSLNPLIIKGTPAAGIRDFVIESLLARGLDEPFTLYGLLAESIDVPDDRSSITFNLNPKARFSDGSPVRGVDVLFSFEVLKEKGRPNHRTYYAKVSKAELVPPNSVRFTFEGASDREMPLILGLMPVLPAHKSDPAKFDMTSLEAPVGSGPYRVSGIDAGRSITYARDPDYWGKDLPVNAGRYNFAEIRYDYYREASALFEAFKTGQIDIRTEEDPGRWAEGYDFPALTEGRVRKVEFATGLPAGMTALAFNTRRPIFKSPEVRQALIHLFDFEFVNRSLYHGLFKRTQSYFERSYLSSAGEPADAAEQALLAPFAGSVKPAVLAGTFTFPASDGAGQNRANWRTAFDLLSKAGYVQKAGKLVDGRSGEPLSFEILATSSGQERLLSSFAGDLQRLGIEGRIRVVDSSQYQQRLTNYDYDMIQMIWPSSLSPGNEQLFRWSSDAAKTPGTFNYVGVENAAADAMIAAMLAAQTEPEFVAAVRALDRVLISGDYVIPLFYVPKVWVAHWTRLEYPEAVPLYGYNLDTWWAKPDR